MSARTSPQPLAVGEASVSTEKIKQSYSSTVQAKQQALNKIELCPVMYDRDEPDLAEVRKMFSSQFDAHGRCNVGQLEFRHLLIRFDLFDDYVRFLSKSTGYFKSKGEEYFFRTFPWSLGFNPKEETSMAVVWISLPGLPPNFFAKRSLMSIASAVGKPLAVDKATQDRTRPSTARVKVIVDLLNKHPKKVTLQILDSVSGKLVEFHQQIVFDNLPKYCDYCKHQGHDVKVSRIRKETFGAEVVIEDNVVTDLIRNDGNEVDKLQGDARDFLNGKRAVQRAKDLQEETDNSGVELSKVTQHNVHSPEALTTQTNAVLNENCGHLKQNDELSQTSVTPKTDADQLSMTEMAEASHITSPVELMKESSADSAQAEHLVEKEGHFAGALCSRKCWQLLHLMILCQ